MSVTVSLYSKKENEIYNFLKKYNNKNLPNKNILEWKNSIENPTELADIIGVFIENNEDFEINMWVSLDADFFINVTNNNADKIIRYLFERYPY